MSEVSDIRDFRGIVPAECGGLPGNYADIAENVDLRGGCLEPWRAPVHVAGFAGFAGRVSRHGCCWRSHPSPCAKFVTAGLCQDLIVSAPEMPPIIYQGTCCDAVPCPLALPKPEPVVITGGSEDPDCFAYPRSYLITYCRGCDESMPSVPSNAVCSNKSDPVRIDFPMPPMDYKVDTVHLYRLMPIQELTNANIAHPELATVGSLNALLNQDVTSAYFLVGSYEIDTAAVVDVGSFQTKQTRTLTTEDHVPPPEGLCIVGETEYGSLVGYAGRRVYFSERNKFHAWPAKNACIFEECVDDVAVCGDRVFVFTGCRVYSMQDRAECNDGAGRAPQLIKGAPPLIANGAYTATGGGVLYASRDGLITVGPDQRGAIVHDRVSGPFFRPSDWHEIEAHTIRMAKHEGQLFFTTRQGTWIMDMDLDNAGNQKLNLTTLSMQPQQWIEGDCGELFLLADGQVWEWNKARQRLRYRWRQAPQNPCDEVSIGAFKVKFQNATKHKPSFDGVHVALLNDGGQFTACSVDSPSTMTASNNRGTDTQIDITGREHVRMVRYGSGRRCLEMAGATQ